MAAFFSARSTSRTLLRWRHVGRRVAPAVRRLGAGTLSVQGPLRRDGDEKPVRRTPEPNAPGNASAKVRTDTAGFSPEYPSSPVYAGRSIKPAAGACSLGPGA